MSRHASAGLVLALLCGTAFADGPPTETTADVEMGQTWRVLREIGAPAVLPGAPDTAAVLRRQPPSVCRAAGGYESGDADTRLRRAVRKAQVALWVAAPAPAPPELAAEVARARKAWRADPSCFRAEYRAPAPRGEGRFKEAVLRDSREAARILLGLSEALEELEEAGPGRAREPRRWRANYDLMLARLRLQVAQVYEHQSMLGRLRKDAPPLERAVHGGWRLVRSQTMTGDPAGRKMARGAHQALDLIMSDYPGTPWEVLARHAREAPIGLTLQPVK
ncbi:MAG TPA: hypothetical protein VFE78_04140 [Gemmataceae bacterium]|jgi:hypothetical protein|nr:hypothetical protein [Gemmataceae bacterium]